MSYCDIMEKEVPKPRGRRDAGEAGNRLSLALQGKLQARRNSNRDPFLAYDMGDTSHSRIESASPLLMDARLPIELFARPTLRHRTRSIAIPWQYIVRG